MRGVPYGIQILPTQLGSSVGVCVAGAGAAHVNTEPQHIRQLKLKEINGGNAEGSQKQSHIILTAPDDEEDN